MLIPPGLNTLISGPLRNTAMEGAVWLNAMLHHLLLALLGLLAVSGCLELCAIACYSRHHHQLVQLGQDAMNLQEEVCDIRDFIRILK
jgi:hypothetical protein